MNRNSKFTHGLNTELLPIPTDYKSVIIGKAGVNIKLISSIIGVRSATVNDTHVIVIGTTFAIQESKKVLDGIIEKSVSRNVKSIGYLPRFTLNICNLDHKLVVNLVPFKNDNNNLNYIQVNQQKNTSDLLQMSSLTLYNNTLTPQDRTKTLNFLSSLSKTEFNNLDIGMMIGKNLFYPPKTSSLTSLSQIYKHKRQFKSELTIDQVNLFRDASKKLGYRLQSQSSSHVVHLFDLKTNEKSSFHFNPNNNDNVKFEKDKGTIDFFLSKQCYYELLGITKRASQSEIKSAFRRLSLQIHPDKNHHPAASYCFRIAKTGYDTLTGQGRALYDRSPYPIHKADDLQDLKGFLENKNIFPIVTKYTIDHARLGFIQIIKSGIFLDGRVAIKSKTDMTSALDLKSTLSKLVMIEKAWTNKSVDGGMKFDCGAALKVQTVRYKEEELYTSENFEVSVNSSLYNQR